MCLKSGQMEILFVFFVCLGLLMKDNDKIKIIMLMMMMRCRCCSKPYRSDFKGIRVYVFEASRELKLVNYY